MDPYGVGPCEWWRSGYRGTTCHPHAALLLVDFLLGPDGQKILERFKYGSAAKDYGFNRWYPEAGLTNDQYERQLIKWEKLMNSIARR